MARTKAPDFEAQRGASLPPGTAHGLVITGQFVSIDQGNRAERVAIGLGAGRSDVRVRAQVFADGQGGRQLVDEIEVDAKSGLAPGMAETMGAGALAGHLVVSTLVSGGVQTADESLGASVVADYMRARLADTSYAQGNALTEILRRDPSFAWAHLSLARVTRRHGVGADANGPVEQAPPECGAGRHRLVDLRVQLLVDPRHTGHHRPRLEHHARLRRRRAHRRR